MRRSMWRVATTIVASAACIAASPAAIAGEGWPAVLGESAAGRYIVMLDGEPLALYRGGVDGIPASSPAAGEQLDARGPSAERYLMYLREEQQRVADAVGADIAASYRVTSNAFVAELTSGQLSTLRARADVVDVFADETRVPGGADASSAIGASTAQAARDAVWASVGGADRAGEGVVVGVVGTGIAADSPSFAGEPLAEKDAAGSGGGSSPHLDGTAVVVERADGGVFHSETVAGDGWSKHDYSTKLVGAQYFSDGAVAAGFDFGADRLSPLDGEGHGSTVAGIAAGAAGVVAGVGGVGATVISGVAPAARVAAYKACFAGPNELTRNDDLCALSDVLAAIDQAVVDGVDVLDYAVGPGSPRAGMVPEDAALLAAAAAGIVVVTSAGDDGPTAGSVAHALPGVLTVGASDMTGRVAGYSGRGPSSGWGGTVLSPSVTASGGGQVAPSANAPDTAPAFGIAAGTAVAAAEVTGLAAIYLSVHRDATVSEVVSAMMTTARAASDDGDGASALTEGAGRVDPAAYLAPGLLYLSGTDEWGDFLHAAVDPAASALEPNLPGIQVPGPALAEVVTRVVTATRPATYAVEVDLPGFDVEVVPHALVFGAAGESQSFRLTVSRTDAPLDEWTTGSVTWTSDAVDVRMPIAVGPDAGGEAAAGG